MKLHGTDSCCSSDRCQVQVWTPQKAADPDKQLPNRRLACMHLYFWHLWCWTSAAINTVSSPDGGGMAAIWNDLSPVQPQPCPLHWNWALLESPRIPFLLQEAVGMARTAVWGIFHFLEGAGNLKAFTVLLGDCKQQNKLGWKWGHLGKFVSFLSLFWKSSTPAP